MTNLVVHSTQRLAPLDQLIGRTLVFGIPGTKVRPADVRLFRDTHAAGLILYRINYESPAQIRRLIHDLEEALGRRLLVTVDHEGGRVVMFGGGVTVFPDNLAFGKGGGPADAAQQGRIEARELRRMGADVNFSPTVDVLTEAYSPNIGIRAYGQDPKRVAALATARIKAMQAAGVSACAKHFPGLGPATIDPHLDLPVIDVGWTELRRNHLIPFQASLRAGVDMVMSSHPLYPKLDPSRSPATFSRKLIHGLLRRELGYDGVISSDDLEMGALKHFGGIGSAAVRAVKAGHDMLLVCHKADLQRKTFDALRSAYRDGTLKVQDLERSVERISALRAWKQPRFAPGAPQAEPAGRILAERIARKAVEVEGSLPSMRGPGKTCVIFPRLAEVAKIILVEPELAHEKRFLNTRVPGAKDIQVVPLDPGPRDIQRAVAAARRAARTIFFCYEAHMKPGCRALLDNLQKKTPGSLVVVLLRTPYDRNLIRPSIPTVTAFGYRRAQIDACLARLFRR